MSSVKWPTEYGAAMLAIVQDICGDCENATVREQWYEVQDFIREKTTTKQMEVDVQANVNFKAIFEMPCDHEDVYVGSDVIQELDQFVEVQLFQPDENNFMSFGDDGAIKLLSVDDAQIDSFIDRDAL